MNLFQKLQQSALRMVNGADRPFDLVIFGASGYTGQCVIEYVAKAVDLDLKKQAGESKQKLRWAVAGRSEDRLAKALITATLNLPGFDHNKIEMIICDVKDPASVKKMAMQTKVLLNCVGPYR